jgi:hypothetical protein
LSVFVSKVANMQIPHLINLLYGEMTAWRQDLHAHPELGFEEHPTSEFVAGKLAEFGCEVPSTVSTAGASMRRCGVRDFVAQHEKKGNGASRVAPPVPVRTRNPFEWRRRIHQVVLSAAMDVHR